MRIGELAHELGINPRTIRYYESIGLLPEPARTDSNYRVYSDRDIRRLAFIKSAQRLGITLDEIGEILAFHERGAAPCGYVRTVLDREVTAIDRRLADLHALRAELIELQARAQQLPPAGDGYCQLIHVDQNRSARDARRSASSI